MTAPRREHDPRRVPDITFNTKDAGGHVTPTDYMPKDARDPEDGYDPRDRHWEGRTLKNPYRADTPSVASAVKSAPIKIDSRMK